MHGRHGRPKTVIVRRFRLLGRGRVHRTGEQGNDRKNAESELRRNTRQGQEALKEQGKNKKYVAKTKSARRNARGDLQAV